MQTTLTRTQRTSRKMVAVLLKVGIYMTTCSIAKFTTTSELAPLCTNVILQCFDSHAYIYTGESGTGKADKRLICYSGVPKNRYVNERKRREKILEITTSSEATESTGWIQSDLCIARHIAEVQIIPLPPGHHLRHPYRHPRCLARSASPKSA